MREVGLFFAPHLHTTRPALASLQRGNMDTLPIPNQATPVQAIKLTCSGLMVWKS